MANTLGFSQLKLKYSHFFDKECELKCEYGWQKIIEDFCAAIDLIIISPSYNHLKIMSIKQKCGTLIIDYQGGDDLVKELVDFTESLSYNMCEVCGQEGKLYAEGKWVKWSSYKTLCRSHAVQLHYYEIKIKKGGI